MPSTISEIPIWTPLIFVRVIVDIDECCSFGERNAVLLLKKELWKEQKNRIIFSAYVFFSESEYIYQRLHCEM